MTSRESYEHQAQSHHRLLPGAATLDVSANTEDICKLLMIGNLGMIMAILMPAAMLATLPVLYLLYRRRSKAIYQTLVGLALFVAALLITLLIPIVSSSRSCLVSSIIASSCETLDTPLDARSR